MKQWSEIIRNVTMLSQLGLSLRFLCRQVALFSISLRSSSFVKSTYTHILLSLLNRWTQISQ